MSSPRPPVSVTLRLAVEADIPELKQLIELSVRGLQAGDYTQAQIDGALGSALGLDSQLIADRSYFAAQDSLGTRILGCGGWSDRRTLFGSDGLGARDSARLDPAVDAARIRAIFVHPEWARRGLGSILLKACEDAAAAAGFRRFEMGSTLTGVPLYRLKGYTEIETIGVPLPNGESLPVVRMTKSL